MRIVWHLHINVPSKFVFHTGSQAAEAEAGRCNERSSGGGSTSCGSEGRGDDRGRLPLRAAIRLLLLMPIPPPLFSPVSPQSCEMIRSCTQGADLWVTLAPSKQMWGSNGRMVACAPGSTSCTNQGGTIAAVTLKGSVVCSCKIPCQEVG